jgi:hypothetical protein
MMAPTIRTPTSGRTRTRQHRVTEMSARLAMMSIEGPELDYEHFSELM